MNVFSSVIEGQSAQHFLRLMWSIFVQPYDWKTTTRKCLLIIE